MDLNGKTVVYLGGFGGIGQKCLSAFLSKGVTSLAVLDLKENSVVLKELRDNFPNANIFFVAFDITKKENIEAAYKAVVEKICQFDVVVNGCGILNDSLIEMSVQVNLLGLIQSSLCAFSYMDKSKGGRGGIILNISSVAGLQPWPVCAAYSATKAGVLYFTRSMGNQIYYEPSGVAFITVCPGVTDTTLVDNMEGKEISPYSAHLRENVERLKRQSPEECARSLVRVIEIGENGSTWLLDLGDATEVEFPILWDPSLK